jgi:hypothetical protein
MNPSDEQAWLGQHIPHRLRACLTWLPLQSELLTTITDANAHASIMHRCFLHTVSEGRMAAMRWLIEFVGIRDVNGKPEQPKLRKTDVSISFIQGGKPIDIDSTEAMFLAKVWKGCSQASGHPTQDTNHPDVDPKTLDKALRIIVGHLKRTIYSADPDKLIALMLTGLKHR